MVTIVSYCCSTLRNLLGCTDTWVTRRHIGGREQSLSLMWTLLWWFVSVRLTSSSDSSPWTQYLKEIHLFTEFRRWKLEKVLARVRIGHTMLTHSYLYSKQLPPQCDTCGTRMDVIHILNSCVKFSSLRSIHYSNPSHPVLETLMDSPVNVQNFFIFLQKCELISLL